MAENQPRASFENRRFTKNQKTGPTGTTTELVQTDVQSTEIVREKETPGDIFAPTNKSFFQDPIETGLPTERAKIDSQITEEKVNQEVQHYTAPKTHITITPTPPPPGSGNLVWQTPDDDLDYIDGTDVLIWG